MELAEKVMEEVAQRSMACERELLVTNDQMHAGIALINPNCLTLVWFYFDHPKAVFDFILN